ncbi:single-stranded DNA-binding protein [Rathayibacter toxicus]|uniref:single-stranded DNA-binding protein n=1 Tax=Rathayibacter toxicus TaxID=145458 RepID=UPI001C05C30D|nr:single-stranded DNA-binding protein [Rathayibacter toxicus]QWL30270.1 single-stranded DNA-binding protein [Rathayibacter toxicus]
MTDTLTVIGVLGTEPRSIDTANGTAMTTFRLASSQRRYDRSEQRWVEGSTNWYTVTAFNGLAGNALASLARGDRVIVTGRLTVRAWEAGGKSGTDITVTAEGIGHDLAWGTTRYVRTVGRGTAPGAASAPVASAAWGEEELPTASVAPGWVTAEPGVARSRAEVVQTDPERSLQSTDTPF